MHGCAELRDHLAVAASTLRLVAELSLASFNTHAGMDGWGRRYDLVDACRKLEADVIVLQETFAPREAISQAEAIGAELGYHVVELPLARAWRRKEGIEEGEGWEPRKVLPTTAKALRVGGRVDYSRRYDLAGYEEGTWGLAVLARTAVASWRSLQLGKLKRDFTQRGALVVDLDVNGGEPGRTRFTVVGTHAAHLTVGSPRQIRQLHKQLPGGDSPAALAGDMNLWGPPLSLLLPGWRRAVRGRTWPAWRPHSQPDHIFVNGAVAVGGGSVVRAGNSDHRAVRAILRF